MSIWGLSLSLSHHHSPSLTCMNRCVWSTGHAVRLQRWRMSHWDKAELYIIQFITRRADGRGLWSRSKPQISLLVFSLCHFPKMWVSLVNTLNPRLRENITAFCAVGNWLHTRELGPNKASPVAFHRTPLARFLCRSHLAAETICWQRHWPKLITFYTQKPQLRNNCFSLMGAILLIQPLGWCSFHSTVGRTCQN